MTIYLSAIEDGHALSLPLNMIVISYQIPSSLGHEFLNSREKKRTKKGLLYHYATTLITSKQEMPKTSVDFRTILKFTWERNQYFSSGS